MDNKEIRQEGAYQGYQEYSASLQPTINASQILQTPNLGTTLFKGILGLNLIIAMFFSMVISVGTYFFSKQEAAFLAKAVKTQAYVTDVREQRRVREKRSHPNHDSNRRRSRSSANNYNNFHNNHYNDYNERITTEVSYDYIVSLKFRDKTGKIYETRLSDGENSMLREGDKIDILYNPENPSDVKFFKNAGNAGMLTKVSQIAGIIFIGLLSVFLLTMKSNKEQYSNNNINPR